ncbi:MAG: nucleotidyltransferase domain-containing protein [Prevotella sp.]|nr:nucleotidyltransferase domain-containing protein [Prevotella sp.]
MKSTAEILELLKTYKPTAVNKYGLTRIGVFGSVARGEQTPESDVDICYEGKAPSLLTLDLIQRDLEYLFKSNVDLIRVREGMNSILRQRIQKEGIYV